MSDEREESFKEVGKLVQDYSDMSWTEFCKKYHWQGTDFIHALRDYLLRGELPKKG